jgi:chromosome segregation ATPase
MTDRTEQIDKQIVQINRRLETHERKKRELKDELTGLKNKLRSANTYGSTQKLRDQYSRDIVIKTNEIGKVDADILLEHHTLRELQPKKQGTITHLRELAVMPSRPRSRSPTRRRSRSRSPTRRRSHSRSPTRRRSHSRSPTRRRSHSRSPTRRSYNVPDNLDIEEDADLMAQLEEDLAGGRRRRKTRRRKTRRRKSKNYFSLF